MGRSTYSLSSRIVRYLLHEPVPDKRASSRQDIIQLVSFDGYAVVDPSAPRKSYSLQALSARSFTQRWVITAIQLSESKGKTAQ